MQYLQGSGASKAVPQHSGRTIRQMSAGRISGCSCVSVSSAGEVLRLGQSGATPTHKQSIYRNEIQEVLYQKASDFQRNASSELLARRTRILVREPFVKVHSGDGNRKH